MSGDLVPVRFRSANDEQGSPEWNGFHAGQNSTGIQVWVELDTLFDIIKDDINRHGSVLTDWTDTLAWMWGSRITEAESGDKLYLIPDCFFEAVEPQPCQHPEAGRVNHTDGRGFYCPACNRTLMVEPKEPWWVGRRDRDQLTGAYIPGTERQDPLTGEWH